MIDRKINKKRMRYFFGAACAVLIPVVLGLILFAIPFIAEQEASCRYGAKNASIACNIYQEFGDAYYWFIMLPIILSFIFITPIIAAFSVSSLIEEDPLYWSDVVFVSIRNSSKANLWVAVIYNIILMVMLIGVGIKAGGIDGALGMTIPALLFTSLIQFILWLCITLPLCLICASVFGIIVRPQKEEKKEKEGDS